MKEYTQKEKIKARAKTLELIKNGLIIKKDKCELCDSTSRIQMHHFSYSVFSKVMWVCRKCHNNIHHLYLDARRYEVENLLENIKDNIEKIYKQLELSKKNSIEFIGLLDKYNEILTEKLEDYENEKK